MKDFRQVANIIEAINELGDKYNMYYELANSEQDISLMKTYCEILVDLADLKNKIRGNQIWKT